MLGPFAGVKESQAENQGFCFRPAKFEMCIRQPYGGVKQAALYESLELRGKTEAKNIRKCL